MQKLPQLTLRDLFWLVALVAMGCGWWMDRIQLSSEKNTEERYRANQRRNWEDILRRVGR